MWTESPVRDGHADTGASLQEARLRKERRRRRRRALTTVLLILAGTAGIGWWMYDTTGGDLSRTLLAAAAGGLLLVALSIWRSHRRTMRALNSPLPAGPAVAASPSPVAGPPLAESPPPIPTTRPGAPASPEHERDFTPMPDRPRRRLAGLPLLRGPRSVQVVTVILVAAVVLAVVAAGTALVVAIGPVSRPAGASAASGTDPALGGFAADCVKLVLRAGEDKRAELEACYGNALPDLAGVPAGSFDATGATARQISELRPGYWSVLVAVDQVERVTNPNTHKATWQSMGLRYYKLGVARRAARLVAVDLPAPVAPPPVADRPDLTVAALDQPNSTDPRTDRLSRFFGAFLAGAGALDDSVLPGKRATPIQPPPYATVTIRAVGYDTDPTQPAANARVVVAATTSAGNVQVLGYSLDLVRRDGRWYVASLDGAPALATS